VAARPLRRLAGSSANAATPTTTTLPFPTTRNVYVEVKVAHTAAYMAEKNRKDQLLELVRDAAKVEPGERVSVSAVDGSGGPASASSSSSSVSLAGARLAAPAPTLTYGAVVFNDEHGDAEREVAAVKEPGTLERVAGAAKAFGVAVLDIGARVVGGGSRRRRVMSV
jgi:hypothetical protein